MEFGEPANQHSINLGVGAGNPAVPRVIPGPQPIGLATTNLAPVLPQLVAPLGFGFTPDMFMIMEMERSLSLYQVGCLLAFSCLMQKCVFIFMIFFLLISLHFMCLCFLF